MIRGLLGLVAAASLMQASEASLAPVRLQVGTDYHQGDLAIRAASGGRTSQDLSWGRTGRIGLLWSPIATARSDGSGILGLELIRVRRVIDSTALGDSLDQTSYLLGAHQGFAWACSPTTTIEATLLVAGGLNRFEEGAFTRGAWEAGLRLGVNQQVTWSGGGQGPVVGVALLAGYAEARGHLGRAVENYRMVLTARGVAPALVVGWAW